MRCATETRAKLCVLNGSMCCACHCTERANARRGCQATATQYRVTAVLVRVHIEWLCMASRVLDAYLQSPK